MSKNITIQEGGTAKQLTVNKLKTNLVGNGTCLWVPEDEVSLGTKYINEDGTYNASDDGYYGYSQVTVSGIGKAVGKDGDGDDAVASVGPDGELDVTKLPSSIEITTQPSKLTYQDGESISTSGMVIKGYLETGGEWGIVPLGEITLTPNTASYAAAEKDPDTATSDLDTGVEQPILCGSCKHVIGRTYNNIKDTRTNVCSGTGVFVSVSSDNVRRIIAGENEGVLASVLIEKRLDYPGHTEITTTEDTISSNNSYTHDNKTVYYNYQFIGFTGYSLKSISPVATGNASNKAGQIAWTIVYGTKTQGGAHQTITISWSRPGDGKVLETTFSINVNQTSSVGGN